MLVWVLHRQHNVMCNILFQVICLSGWIMDAACFASGADNKQQKLYLHSSSLSGDKTDTLEKVACDGVPTRELLIISINL